MKFALTILTTELAEDKSVFCRAEGDGVTLYFRVKNSADYPVGTVIELEGGVMQKPMGTLELETLTR